MFRSPKDAKDFALAGNAILTLRSTKTGAYYTYRIRAPKENGLKDNIRFVSLLSGPNNSTYIGIIRNDEFTLTRSSKLGRGTKPVAAFEFFTRKVLAKNTIPEGLEVRHEGYCGRCGRRLTVPESIDRGIGPECQRIISFVDPIEGL